MEVCNIYVNELPSENDQRGDAVSVQSVTKTRYKHRRRRRQGPYLFILTGIFVVSYLGVMLFVGPSEPRDLHVRKGSLHYNIDSQILHRRLLSTTTTNTTNATVPPTTLSSSLSYPQDLFTLQQLKQGAVILHILGMIYMFVALAIVCDEFFVPALEVITESLKISADVAGATFMAAGGSAPELATSFIGTFYSGDNVGIGTIVGSAVFNILFVIGMCAVFSKGVLTLTWWPLFRDVSFYSLSLAFLIWAFSDEYIQWYEALILMLCYVAYVIFMKFNHNVEGFVKSCCKKNKVTTVRSTDNLIEEQKSQRCSQPVLHSGAGKFRHGVLQLMIHTIDPLGEAKVHEKAIHLHAVASLKVLIDTENGIIEANHNNSKNGSIPAISNGQINCEPTRNLSQETTLSQQTTLTVVSNPDDGTPVVSENCTSDTQDAVSQNSDKTEKEELEEENEPLDISWPDTWRKRITYILVAPIVFPLWITLPDVRRPERRKFYPWTFVGSILWIGGYSWLMNWWAAVTGNTIGIGPEVMGLTLLAAGTSIPDLITSVIVAKKGYGDMAVSSSVGSNIFDVTIGLPFPWILWSFTHGLQSIKVVSTGLFCSIILLFSMLLFVIITIAAFKWKMNKFLGLIMFGLYMVFITLSVLLELKYIPCFVGS